MMRSRRPADLAGGEVWLVGAVLVGAAVVRSVGLGAQSLWLDESVTADFVHYDLHRLLLAVRSIESTPPLYYVLVWAWAKVFGSSEVGLRSLSVVLGVGTVGVTYVAARVLAGWRAAALASVFVALSPVMVWYSQEARAYALLAFLSACSFLFFARALRAGWRMDLAGWSVSSALALTAHYFAVFLVAAEAAFLLWRLARRRRVLIAFVPIVLVGAALLPLLLHQRALGHTNWIAVMPVHFRLLQLATWFTTGRLRWLIGVVAGGAIGVASLWLLARARAEERTGGLAALSMGTGTLLIAGLVSVLGFDYFLFRNVLQAWVPLAIGVAAGLMAKRSDWLGPALGALLSCLFLAGDIAVLTRSDLKRDDWHAVASVVSAQSPTALIVVYPLWGVRPLIHYGGGEIECLGCMAGARVSLFGNPVGPYDERRPVSVRDVWFVAVHAPFESDYTGRPRPAGVRFTPPPGFRPESVRALQHFVLRHYTASTVKPVNIPQLSSSTRSSIPVRVLWLRRT